MRIDAEALAAVVEQPLDRRATRGTLEYARLPLVLLGILAVISLATLWNPPAGRVSWFLEVGPGLAMVAVLGAVYARFPVSHFVYVCVFLHIQILIYGGYYTYAMTPLGNWAKE